jgi:hypothetical protein
MMELQGYMVLTRSFVGFVSDTKDIPSECDSVHSNARTIRQKRRSRRQ